MAELEQLRVGVLQQLDGGFGAGLRVVDEGRVPSDHGEVVGIVGNAGLQNLLALAFGEHGHLAADDLGDLVSLDGEQVVGRGRAVNLAHVEDEVVFLQPLRSGIGLDSAGAARSSFCLTTREASFSKLVSEVQRQESSTSLSQSAGKGQLEDQADDAVIVVLDLALKALAAVEDERVQRSSTGGRW